jgi:hypothetical protein
MRSSAGHGLGKQAHVVPRVFHENQEPVLRALGAIQALLDSREFGLRGEGGEKLLYPQRASVEGSE